jgi:hypothetical protein
LLEIQKTTITSLCGILPNHMYNVDNGWEDCNVNLSAQTLLDIAAYGQANRARLEQEAREDAENRRTHLEDTVETHPSKEEWRYRTSDLLLSPPSSEGKSADEDAEHNQRVQLKDNAERYPSKEEWRYRTSDLIL